LRTLFDQGTPAPLRQYLPGHTIATAFERLDVHFFRYLERSSARSTAERKCFDLCEMEDYRKK
jgi:hypothetical protein